MQLNVLDDLAEAMKALDGKNTFHFFVSTFQMAHDSVIAGFLDRIHESVRMLPVRPALCDLEAPGWGSLGFRTVHLLLPGSIAVWLLCGLLYRSCFPLPCQSLR